MTHDPRIQRRRQDDLRAYLAGRPGPRDNGAPSYLCQVYDGGHIPTSPNNFFLTHPIDLAGAETEGDSPTVTVNEDESRAVYVIGSRAPKAGENLVARLVPYRWVAECGKKRKSTGGACGQMFVPRILTWSVNPFGPGQQPPPLGLAVAGLTAAATSPWTLTWQPTPAVLFTGTFMSGPAPTVGAEYFISPLPGQGTGRTFDLPAAAWWSDPIALTLAAVPYGTMYWYLSFAGYSAYIYCIVYSPNVGPSTPSTFLVGGLIYLGVLCFNGAAPAGTTWEPFSIGAWTNKALAGLGPQYGPGDPNAPIVPAPTLSGTPGADDIALDHGHAGYLDDTRLS